MKKTGDEIGRLSNFSGKRKIVKIYTKRANRLYEVVKWFLIVAFFPIVFPVYALIYIGLGAERVFDWLSDVLDKILELIVPNRL